MAGTSSKQAPPAGSSARKNKSRKSKKKAKKAGAGTAEASQKAAPNDVDAALKELNIDVVRCHLHLATLHTCTVPCIAGMLRASAMAMVWSASSAMLPTRCSMAGTQLYYGMQGITYITRGNGIFSPCKIQQWLYLSG